MSSIAYVTDENMLEYHRLCGARNMIFWRLSTQRTFTDFQKGDLLFFYSRAQGRKVKGLIGYAHYVKTEKLSLKQMWKKYGTMNGYETELQLREAITKAAKDKPIPSVMNCLYLEDAVFFNEPVYPNDVGLTISRQLESYMYLDQKDPDTTRRILRKAEANGIDLWSASQSFAPEDVFQEDEIRHQIKAVRDSLPEEDWSTKEKARAIRLAKEQSLKPGWEFIRGSRTDLIRIQKDQVTIALPFVAQEKDRSAMIRSFLGKMMLYRLNLKESGLKITTIQFEIIFEEPATDLLSYVEKINNEKTL